MQGTFDTLFPALEKTEDELDHHLQNFVTTLQALPGGPSGYRLRRILLTNFWLYGQQEFEIPHGRLFLAGENASGKSTVLTAALPLALDGDLRPNRLDTFGGRERRIEYYVLGGAESATPFNYERRTAYIALEFEWCNPDAAPIAPEQHQRWENGERDRTRYLTIGLSLAGNVNASEHIRPLRFLITDGSRLGYELDTVYETGSKREKRAYDHSRFRQMLEGHGIICDTQAEYERQVARYLFGFNDVKDFQKLIDLLLVLRRPNLSTELNFSKVHEYLKQSLRRIPSETTHRVIGTIERIDAIQGEIERIQDAYDATERLHQQQEQLSLIRTQMAAFEYARSQNAQNAVQKRVDGLQRDYQAAIQERQQAMERLQAMQAKLTQVHGQIQVVENSEGLQVAQQLATVRERVSETNKQLQWQAQNVAAARRTVSNTEEKLARVHQQFTRTKTEIASHLKELHTLADKSYWEVVTLQLDEAEQQLHTLVLEMSNQPTLPIVVSLLAGDETEERLVWLRRLEELHAQKTQADTTIKHVRENEATRFQELDEARQRFQQARDKSSAAQQQVQRILEPFLVASELAEAHTLLNEGAFVLESSFDEEASITLVVENFATQIKEYRQLIEQLEQELSEAMDQAQSELDELQLLTGSKQQEITTLQALYEQKEAEPEWVPVHSSRRSQARTRLAELGIIALPLYALLDFTPELAHDSGEAGRIEYILEDAGLLDALVIAPSQFVAAETILIEEGLSDCLLRLPIDAHPGTHPSANQCVDLRRWLQFDASVRDYLATQAPAGELADSIPAWETLTSTIINTLSAAPEIGTGFALTGDGNWTHGLLSGHASHGVASAIGKNTRLQVRQHELDVLAEQRASLEQELHWLHGRLKHYEQQIEQLHEQQKQLRKVLKQSGLEESYAELFQIHFTLEESKVKYQKAHQQTQEARQSYNALIGRLERECRNIGVLASNGKEVQQAITATDHLKIQARSLQTHYNTLGHAWEEYRQENTSLIENRENAATVTQLYEHVQQQALQAQAEAQELQRIAENTNVEALSERLRDLRTQQETLAGSINVVQGQQIRADERANNVQSTLMDAQELLRQAQEECSSRQEQFIVLLSDYPVKQLVQAQQLTVDGNPLAAAHSLLDTQLHKELLEQRYRDSYNLLVRIFNKEQSILLEYGPDLDEQGHIVFLHEQKSRPVELLKLLSERIEMQKMLLSQEERQLFENFLLQEIAEAIRAHILEAEEWVQHINDVLSGLPMIGEHYALQWKALGEYDSARLGSHLAQHYRLLRKPAQSLTSEESETLMHAFRQEIEAVRLRQLEAPDTNFMDALEQVFDYREWFHFDVLVTPVGGQRQRLTDRVAGTRSGAEQLFALYIPLFAALGALYRAAAPGAPRLMALDEAFDKVSNTNTQRMMAFLVSQDFQWIMTGPQVSGMGAKIPASARYLMIHEKGSPFATASPSFWSDSLDGPASRKDE